MKSALARWLAVSGCTLCLALTALPVAAKSKPRGARLKPAPAVTYADGQSAQQRERAEHLRLKNECRGRPNAGACLGHTR